MNERIKKLLEQATIDALFETKDAVDCLDNSVAKQQRQLQLEKFAELIVLECADWLSHREFASPEALKHHFGVK